MGTTKGAVAARLLRSLDAHGFRYVVLHKAETVNSDAPCSDIDIVVDRDPRAVTEALLADFARHELLLVIRWPSEFGTLNTFWITTDGCDGVQLDMLHDPEGKGCFGLRTDQALLALDPSPAWPPRLSPMASLTYQLSKRLSKGQIDKARELVRELLSVSSADRARSVQTLLAPRRQRAVLAATEGHYPHSLARRLTLLRCRLTRRGLLRLSNPIGLVIPVSGTRADLDAVVRAWQPIFPRVQVLDGDSARRRLAAAAMRRRPAVVFARLDGASNPAVELGGDLRRDLASVARHIHERGRTTRLGNWGGPVATGEVARRW